MSQDALPQIDGLDQVRAMLAAGRQPPLTEKLGIFLVEADYGHCVFEAVPDGSSYNPMGTVHGGFIATMLDSACGIAVHTALPPGSSYTTLVSIGVQSGPPVGAQKGPLGVALID
ncbi:PaaI family thioesterase [Novosphingobium colocasiae]|uniref:PaaI family thioesterase n=1 Tax=Novosphingobium colocasiae TaxID=1256513 RepID=UPI0035B0F76C